jgi:protease I
MEKTVVMVVAPIGFSDVEYYAPKKFFEDKQIIVKTASSSLTAKDKLDKEIKVDLLVEDINMDSYSGVIFVGGPGASVYFNDLIIHKIAIKANDKNKVVGAICIAPSILANAGLLDGKRATAFPSEETNLEDKGASYTNESVTVDGNIVTANGPGAVQDFAEKIVELLN